MPLPKSLIDDIREGRTVLFLGAGASISATHPEGKSIPTGKQLSKVLVDKFLGKDYKDIPLIKAAELSITQVGLFTVQDYIADIFYNYGPADFHKLIPTFMWKTILTSNYDLIIERAYDQTPERLQSIVPFLKNTDRVEEKLRKPDTIPYIKLHGCITATNDQQIPLILTTEQYLSHRKSRSFLFERFVHLAYGYPVLYIGSNLDDSDIRAILLELRENAEIIPRSYIILPGLKDTEKRFWESYPFLSYLDITFEDFLREIDAAILKPTRGIVALREEYDHPICARFTVKDVTVPENVKLLLSRDVEHINKNIRPAKLTPQQFYKGYYKDFSPIIHEYDIRRTITDNLISEIFLLDEEERKSNEELYIIKGHAGSGKTILLQRIAWDVAITFDKLCLWLHSNLFPEYEALVELHRLCGERIFLFADPIHKYLEVIELWLTKARSDKLPLTIISTERNHEWNVACKDLYPYVNEIYNLKYLNAQEIERLIEILAENKSLGYLEGLSLDQQKEAFTQRAGRQLLVALYESTLGKPFEEIVYDEFKSIAPIQAQSLYLTICILHRLGIPCRAGLISRAHGISFLEFEARFFKPLEFIVFVYEDERFRDYVYHSRHPVVAEMVFERVLIDEQERFNEYKRILDSVDTGFSSDREAFIRLTNARELLALFRNPEWIRNLYKAGYSRVGEDVALLQQEGIFEMNSPDGSIEKSGELLRKALAKKPDSRMVRHSLAEWALKKSEKATTELEKVKYRRESKSIARELTQQEIVDSYPHHTLIKIGLDELTEFISSGDETTIERKVGEIERIIASAKQAFPDDSFILSEESRFCELINKHPQARISLEKAFANNKGRAYIAVRLAHIYEEDNEPEKAITVISECVDERPSDKYANYTLALLQQKYHPEKKADIKIHLRRSFTDGDSNYAAQYWFARFLYLEDPSGEATKYFKMLGQARLAPEVKDECRGIVAENDIPVIFHGVVHKKEHSFGFIMRDGYQDMIFMHRNDMPEALWDELKEGNRINFQLGFSYRGPKARTVVKEAR